MVMIGAYNLGTLFNLGEASPIDSYQTMSLPVLTGQFCWIPQSQRRAVTLQCLEDAFAEKNVSSLIRKRLYHGQDSYWQTYSTPSYPGSWEAQR